MSPQSGREGRKEKEKGKEVNLIRLWASEFNHNLIILSLLCGIKLLSFLRLFARNSYLGLFSVIIEFLQLNLRKPTANLVARNFGRSKFVHSRNRFTSDSGVGSRPPTMRCGRSASNFTGVEVQGTSHVGTSLDIARVASEGS